MRTWEHVAISLEWSAAEKRTELRFFRNLSPVQTDGITTPFNNNKAEDAIELPYYFLDSLDL
jgi:hypothetical protein